MNTYKLPPQQVLMELNQRPQWGRWKELADGRKLPLNPCTSSAAKVNDIATWGTFEQAYQGEGSSISYLITEHDPFVGIDLDGCRNPATGEVTPEVLELIQDLGSYAEISPSGEGVKVWLKAELPRDSVLGNINGKPIEIYGAGRYFTVTGWHLPGTPTSIKVAQPALDKLLKVIRSVDRPGDHHGGDGVPEVIRHGERNNFLFRRGCELFKLGVPRDVRLDLLLQLNRERCEPPLDEPEVCRANESAERYPPKSKRAREVDTCPALPDGVLLDPSLGRGVGAWVDLYGAHGNAVAPMSPPSFHESMALFIVASMIARRLKVEMPFGPLFPNLWITWLGRTGLWLKTTSLNIGRRVLDFSCHHLVLPSDSTPEALMATLAGRQPTNLSSLPQHLKDDWELGRNFAAQRALIVDEMSSVLAGAGKDYMAGYMEALLRLYDCPDYDARETRGLGRVVVRNAYLPFMGASTPLAMAPYLADQRLWNNGWWSRFAILTPEHDVPEYAEAASNAVVPDDADPYLLCLTDTDMLARALEPLLNRLPLSTYEYPASPLSVRLGSGVDEAWERYNKALRYDLLVSKSREDRWDGSYVRLPVLVMKIACILAALDWPENATAPVIEIPHLARAMDTVEAWRASLHRALAIVQQAPMRDAVVDRVYRRIARAGRAGTSMRDLHDGMKDVKDRGVIERAVEQLAKDGEVEGFEHKPDGPGRPTTKYRAVTE